MYWLGIDIGSISTDLVVLNDENKVEKALYLKTGSRPAEAVREGLRLLGKDYESSQVGGVGVTGSGRNLGSAIAGGDVVKNEITAHARAVAAMDEEIRTVIEIGGQDSKIILMEDGLVSDFAMNTVCAAGTGSFLDRQAARMGVSIEELGDMAASAKESATIAGRCAVFAESDLIHKQQAGVREDALMAGMCRALAMTYMSNVAKGKKVKPKICFQGGVAANKGMRKAFEELLGEEVMVPKEHKIMGAMGAAIIAREKSSGRTGFKGFETGDKEICLSEKSCGGCSNNCSVTAVMAGGREHGFYGDICGKYSSLTFMKNRID
ncbi:MAG: acyl-CoA dehydratase activase [Bacillota bacterium]|nr:acyl-CoA dehydratase activase [Bacillota bacterium]